MITITDCEAHELDEDVRTATLEDIAVAVVSSIEPMAPATYPAQISFKTNASAIYAKLNLGSKDDGFDADEMRAVVDQMLAGHEDEVAQAVILSLPFSPQTLSMPLFLWDASGEAISLAVHLLGFPMGAHGHMPPRAVAPDLEDLVLTTGKKLWGEAWTLAVPEEERCA